jgi:hypothetical protein
MPIAEERRRGVKYYRTIKLPNGKYVHVAIVNKAGKKGGHTVMGRIREKKSAKTRSYTKKHTRKHSRKRIHTPEFRI